MLKSRYALFLITLACALSSCGFSLRGSDILSSKYPSLQLNLVQGNSQFGRLLEQSLDYSGVAVEVISSPVLLPDGVQLSVANEQVTHRPVSVNPRARAAQYQIRLEVTAALSNGEELLFGPENLFVEKEYFEDTDNISGSQEEVEIITTEMRRELVNQLLRRLEGIDVQA